MRLTFRQGIVRHQTDIFNNPTFLSVSGGYVSLIVSPDPTIITFIDGSTDYLYTESTTISNAWGPFTPGSNYWLYWQINPTTGVREFGHTLYEPIESPQAPSSPIVGQMWYNTINKMWYEFTGSMWGQVIRVFACKLDTILVPRSVSDSTPNFKGTQVGENVNVNVGSLAFDSSGEPIKKRNKKFFTTEDVFTTGVPTGASLKVNNILIPGQAQTNVAVHQVVEYSDFNKISPASPYTQGERVYGILEEDAVTNETVNFVTEGIIFDELWDWETSGADVNDPIYIDITGQLTLTPVIPAQLPVGAVIGPQKILFAPRLFPQVTITGGTGVDTFVELLDTPNAYASHGGKNVRVNVAENALEFVTSPIIPTDFLDLTDTPATYDGHGSKTVQVNATENALEFVNVSMNNVGTVGQGLFRDEISGTFNFKNIEAGSNITITDNPPNNTVVIASTGGGSSTFLSLTDTPSAYNIHANKVVTVNPTATALQFTNQINNFIGLVDTPGNYLDKQYKTVKVNSVANGLMFECEEHAYDIATNVNGAPANNDVILRMRAVRAFIIDNFNHRAFAKTTDASNSLILTVKRWPSGSPTSGSPTAGITLGTITFPPNVSWTSGTLTETLFNIGDLLTVEVGTVNGWADLTLSLSGYYTDPNCTDGGGGGG